MKPFFLLLFASISFYTASAQIKGDYMPFGLGYGYETVKDASLSPVSYSGHLGRAQIGYYFQNENWISMLDIAGLAGFQYPDVNREGNNRKTLTILGRLTYHLSRRFYSTANDWHFFAGLISHNTWDFRDHYRYSNSSTNFTGLFSAGPVLTTQKPFTLFSKSFVLSYQAALPVATYYLRPGYVKPFLNEEISSTGFAAWGNYFALDMRTDLIWVLPTGNQLRLSYNWDYSSLDVLNKVQLATHQLSISTVFKF